ncbi:MAG: hypothetical protein WBQ09_13825 [Terriglobales bacterium]
MASGNTTLTPVVPEPRLLGLLGTGSVAVAGLVRYRLRSRQAGRPLNPSKVCRSLAQAVEDS